MLFTTIDDLQSKHTCELATANSETHPSPASCASRRPGARQGSRGAGRACFARTRHGCTRADEDVGEQMVWGMPSAVPWYQQPSYTGNLGMSSGIVGLPFGMGAQPRAGCRQLRVPCLLLPRPEAVCEITPAPGRFGLCVFDAERCGVRSPPLRAM